MRRLASWCYIFLFLLGACTFAGTAAPTSPPGTAETILPSASLPAPGPAPSHQPAPALTGLAMFEGGGWGWNSDLEELYRSTDKGQSWQPVSLPAGNNLDFRSSAFLDLNTAWVVSPDPQDTSQQLLHTTDGGANWAGIKPQGLESLGGSFGFHFTSPRVGWAEAAEGGAGNLYVQVFITTTGGANFQLVPIRGDPVGTVHLCNMCGDSFYYDPSRIMIVTGDMGSMQTRKAVEGMTSFDQGQTWEALTLPLPPKYRAALVTPLTVSFVDDTRGFLPAMLTQFNPDGSSAYRVLILYTTRDGGRSWDLKAGMLEDIPNYPRLQFITAEDSVAQCAKGLCITHDGGESWEPRPLGPEMMPDDERSILQIDFVNASTGWMVISDYAGGVTTYRIFRTVDGAATWTQQ